MSGFEGESFTKRLNEILGRALDDSLGGASEATTAPMTEFKVNKIAFRMDERIMPGWSPDQLSPVERAKHDEEMRQYEIRRNEETLIREAAWCWLQQIEDPATKAVLGLHAMVDQTYGDPECAHCMRDTEMGDHDDWPCETVRVIATAHGIEMP